MELTNIQSSSNLTFTEVIMKLNSRLSGLTQEEVNKRQLQYGLNTIHKRQINIISIFIRQFTSNPLLLILILATILSFVFGQHISSFYIIIMILLSIFLGLWNEYSAEKTIDSLLKKISLTTLVIRNDEKDEIPASQLTIGDIVLLSPGNIISADLRLISVKNLEVNESALTGESKSVFKTEEVLKNETKNFSNITFMGTTVISGSAKGIVIGIGKNTEFGKIAKSATFIKPETDFQKGLSNFGMFLVKVILILTVGIFVINSLIKHDWLDSLLFALAIAVGLTPELLPVIVTISLSHGAGKLAKKKVIAKQLISLENIGNMDVLCTDKTGTLTEGNIELIEYLDAKGTKNHELLNAALICNSAIIHHKIIGNGIDAAIWKYAHKNDFQPDPTLKIIDDEPFDYNRKTMYSIISHHDKTILIAKGAPDQILDYCKDTEHKKELHEKFKSLNNQGLRLIAIATKTLHKKDEYNWNDVRELDYLGYITFLDTPKTSAKEAINHLNRLHVQVKVITGDNELIAQKVCREVGMENISILLGTEIERMDDEQLKNIVNEKNVFARVNPQQKLQIIKALKDNGHTVGYLGDGINDIPALRNADVGISVNTAVDVAKDAASIVILQKSLNVIAEGIMEGRRTFSNTIKYILMGTSSNFGNMFSAAGASFFLPFLPMTPVQILLNNGLYDLSQLSIPSDNVDHESLIKPRKWNINLIRNYMIFFGPISSLYDFLTFFILLYIFKANSALFQTGWFIESMATQVLVVFVIRTSKTPFFLSRPGKWLLFTCFVIVLTAIIIPFTPLAKTLGFISPPPYYFIILIILVSTYLFLVEILKKIFLKKYSL